MPKPLVAIVGRPNVGKSTLFNRIISERKSIVEDIPGVTRDRIYSDTSWEGKHFSVVDTGGFEPESKDIYPSLIKDQIEIAIEESDLILMVLDGKEGVLPGDVETLNFLRKSLKPIIFVVNKIDHEQHEMRGYDFHSLGIENFINVSALHGKNIYDLLDAIAEKLPESEETEEEEGIKVTVLGKPNVGKSTLVNKLIGEERLLTSPVAGTTRDSIDSIIQKGDKKYILIDTAGIRRKAKLTFSVERYSVFRAIRALERSDIVLLMIDAEDGPTHQDARISNLVVEKGKGCILLINKWDLVPKGIAETPNIESILKSGLKALNFSPVLIISALTGRKLNNIFDLIDHVYANYSQRISTKKLNTFLNKLTEIKPPPLYNGKEVKFFYISQPYTKQPTFVIFTNYKKALKENYKKFLENKFREEFNFEGTPIKFIFRERTKTQSEN